MIESADVELMIAISDDYSVYFKTIASQRDFPGTSFLYKTNLPGTLMLYRLRVVRRQNAAL